MTWLKIVSKNKTHVGFWELEQNPKRKKWQKDVHQIFWRKFKRKAVASWCGNFRHGSFNPQAWWFPHDMEWGVRSTAHSSKPSTWRWVIRKLWKTKKREREGRGPQIGQKSHEFPSNSYLVAEWGNDIVQWIENKNGMPIDRHKLMTSRSFHGSKAEPSGRRRGAFSSRAGRATFKV